MVRFCKMNFLRMADLMFGLDAVGSVAFHPYKPAILSASGSRHFFDSDTDSDSDIETSRQPFASNAVKRSLWSQPVTLDSSINVWDFREEELGVGD
jgi:hypothetical protein